MQARRACSSARRAQYLLRAASDVDAFKAFLDDCAHRALRIEALLDEDYTRVGELLQSYADLRLGFVEAAVLAVTERLREPKLANVRSSAFHCRASSHVKALELLPA